MSKRQLYMISCLIICLLAGFGYSWSVLQIPIVRQYKLLELQVSLCFTINVIASTLTPLLFGGMLKKLSNKVILASGGIFIAAGLYASSMIQSLYGIYLFYGVFAGIGVGLIYPRLMSYSVQIFPEKSGLSSGFMAAAYGSGAIFWAPFITKLLEFNSIAGTFKILGITFLIIVPLAFGTGEIHKLASGSENAKEIENENLGEINLCRKEMVRTLNFYMMICIFTLGLISGIMVIGQASPMLQGTLHFSPEKAATFVGIFSICNMCGRFIFGFLADKIGYWSVIATISVMSACCMILIPITKSELTVPVAMGLVAMGYGGYAAVLTPLTSKIFGKKYINENYGVMYVVFGLAALVGPRVAVYFKTINNGSYDMAFYLGAVLSVIGCAISFILKNRTKKEK